MFACSCFKWALLTDTRKPRQIYMIYATRCLPSKAPFRIRSSHISLTLGEDKGPYYMVRDILNLSPGEPPSNFICAVLLLPASDRYLVPDRRSCIQLNSALLLHGPVHCTTWFKTWLSLPDSASNWCSCRPFLQLLGNVSLLFSEVCSCLA